MYEGHVEAIYVSLLGFIFNNDFIVHKFESMELVYIIHKERFVPIKYNIPDILSHVIKYLMNVLPLWGMKKNVTKEAERSRTAVSDNRATIKSTFLINTIVYDVH